MRRYYWVIETTLLLLLLQKLLIVSYSVLGYWIGVSLLLVASYYREGARPYTPILLLAICADFLEFKTVNRCLLAIMGTLMIWISFYKIDVPNKGEFEAGHRYFSWKGIPLSVFYPSDIFGRNVNWIPSKCYNHVLYDIFYVDPRVPRIPFWLFNYLTSFVHTLRMPVYSQTPLKLKDSQATVVIFSHGLGSNMNGHSSMCSWWASNGYIVISLQHFSDNVRIGPTSWEDSKTILQSLLYNKRNHDLIIRAKEMRTVYEAVGQTDLLNLIFDQQVFCKEQILAGHSFGGATAMQTMGQLVADRQDVSKISSLILLDPWFFPLSQDTYRYLRGQKMLMLNTGSFFKAVLKLYKMEEKLGRLMQNNEHTLYGYVIEGADHLCNSDMVFVFGNLLQLTKSVRKHNLSWEILQLHCNMISAFMDGCSYDEILAAGNEYCKTSKIQKKGVKVVKEDRVIADALDPREW